ncbi:MAG: nonstructural protein [Arizlama microvirus]|nr:MAG: nonstructural protein [Arizlama microvirus]
MKILCTIRDAAIDAFGPVLEVRAQGEALRMFKDECNNPESRIYKHPEDYELYKIAMYDDMTGEVQGMKPERLARGQDMQEMAK